MSGTPEYMSPREPPRSATSITEVTSTRWRYRYTMLAGRPSHQGSEAANVIHAMRWSS